MMGAQEHKNINCIFCDIASRKADASNIYEDEDILAFMDIAPVREGQCLIIPKRHIDHFTDIDDDLSARIILVAQKIGRKMMQTLNPTPLRIGYVVHGFGVAHAHFVVVPQHTEEDITSMECIDVKNGNAVVNYNKLPSPSRQELDALANQLKL